MPPRSQRFKPEEDTIIVHRLSVELDSERRVTGKGKFTNEVWQDVATVLHDAGYEHLAKPVSGRFERVRK